MYFLEKQENNITYSVDMLRLKTYITASEFFRFKDIFCLKYSKFVNAFYTSSRIIHFFYNFNIKIDEGRSFWFGFLHNNEKRRESSDTKYNFTIEFNPNKIMDSPIILFILSISQDWFLVSFDFAFDIKVNINDILYNKNRKRQVQIYMNSFNDKTIRIGKNDGRIKIYNKKLESNLDVPYDLTRIEVSCSGNDYKITRFYNFDFDKKYLPEIYLNKYIYSLSDYSDKTLFAILFAIQNGFPFEFLTRTYRNKIKTLLKGDYLVAFSSFLCSSVVNDVLAYYFSENIYLNF